MQHKIDRIPFRLANGTPGTARILIAPLPDGRTLVTCMDDNDDDDAAVNMVVEHLFRTVCDRHQLDPSRIVWVEYNSSVLTTGAGKVGGWERVTWRGTPGTSPKWRQMTPEDWEGLGTEPPPPPGD